MIVSIDHCTWQVLRILVRNGGRAHGSDLRPAPFTPKGKKS